MPRQGQPSKDQPQHVLAPPAKAAIFLVITMRRDAEDGVRDLLSSLAGLVRAVGFRYPEEELSCVVGIGAAGWNRLYDASRPAGLHPFQALTGDVHSAPSTPGDLLFHLRARRLDLCFELARQIMSRLSGRVDVADETHGFRYFDERDLLGFVDGTESPTGPGAIGAVYITDEDPAYSGGSYVIVQKYLHDLDAWYALSIEDQERAFGRHKLSDIEFPDELKPSNSHVALNTITDADGTQRKIVRDNMPFGTVGTREFGTYFIGYANTPDVIEQMLRNMFIGHPAGNYDRILDFSTAVTGNLFFVPTADFLDDQPPRPAVIQRSAHTDDSLNIGGLKAPPANPPVRETAPQKDRR